MCPPIQKQPCTNLEKMASSLPTCMITRKHPIPNQPTSKHGFLKFNFMNMVLPVFWGCP